MARRTEAQEIAALMAANLDALEEAFAPAFDRDKAEAALLPSVTAMVLWIRAREDEDLEIDLSDVTVSGSDLIGTGTIT